MKTGSPHLGPTMPHMAQPPTIQRAIMNRHHQARRPIPNIAPKLEPGITLPSPQSRPTPPSHASSPTSNSSGFHNLTPPASDSQIQLPHQHQQVQQQRMHVTKPQMPHGIPGNPGLVNTGIIGTVLGPRGQGSNGTGSTGGTPTTAAYYPSSFQNHYEQLGKLSRPLLSCLSFYRTMFVLD